MSSPILKTVLLGTLLLSGTLGLAHAQASGDSSDLPCNDACRAWMGPAYTGPASEATTSEDQQQADPSVQVEDKAPGTGDMPDPGSPDERSSPESHPLHPRSIHRRHLAPTTAADRTFERPRTHRMRDLADVSPRRTGHRDAAVTITRPPEPVKASTADTRPANASSTSTAAASDGAVRLETDGKMLTMSLNGNGKSSEDVRLTAEQTDQLVQSIGAARAKMQPQPQQNWAFGQTVASIYDPRWTTEAERRNGNTLLHIRDPRYGWLHYTVPRMTAQQLGTLLRKQAALPVPSARRAEATP